ncbi:CENP-S associating centromere protein X-domain-containing protein [Alternaria rosae]|uniref:CENP-S associating centromere protein X-domain-containing protein n=1 Tax=Alternaria rosae TaxID=1187941 RepID=UPI001E8EAC25|nr:CENP-S associating centromere protein X-domain-containing protein [Alternaria rosae]KAH6872289.1 CENP-S associating centromere protein X-domain-containing protein [Alternaria rosae]
MPPKNATANAARRKGPSFNPPRPVGAPSQASTATKRAPATTSRATGATKKGNAAPSKTAFQPAADVIDLSDDDQDEELAEDLNISDFDDIMDDAPTTNPPPPPPAAANAALAEPVISRALLARLLLENFEDPNIQIQTGAMRLVGKYIDIFVTEAFLRSQDEMKAAAKDGASIDGFLQVEDLEKLAPQLVLDF